jgi:hypothetical protein
VVERLSFPDFFRPVRREKYERKYPTTDNSSGQQLKLLQALIFPPKKEKSPQEALLELLSPRGGGREKCEHCSMTGTFLPFALVLCTHNLFLGHGVATCWKKYPHLKEKSSKVCSLPLSYLLALFSLSSPYVCAGQGIEAPPLQRARGFPPCFSCFFCIFSLCFFCR